MDFYGKALDHQSRYITNGERLFNTQFQNGQEGHLTNVDENENIKMIIQRHTNPLNEGLLDKKAKFLNSNGDIFHIGNIVFVTDENQKYIAVTEPIGNKVYSGYRIRPLYDKITFDKNATEFSIDGILASGMLYKESSYVGQENVFEDNEMKAIIVTYDGVSDTLELFDNVKVNDINYKIAKIDDDVLKKYNKEYGILQIVVFLSPISSIEKVNVVTQTSVEMKGLLKYARVKDKKLNSISRELLCNYGVVKTGDYIKYTFDSDDLGTMEEETYMVYNLPSKYDGYDISLVYRCLNSFKMLDLTGNIIEIPYYFEDNRTRIDKTTNNDYIEFLNSSLMIIFQNNELTKKFVERKINRVMIKDSVYKITGVSDLDEGLIHLGLVIDEINLSQDLNGVADYVSQMAKINSSNISDTHIVGESKIFKGYDWLYELSEPVSKTGTYWEVNNDKITIVEFDDNSCKLLVTAKYSMGDKFTLTANIINIDNSIQKIQKEITLE